MGHAITGGGFFNIDVEPIKEPNHGELYEAVIHFASAPSPRSCCPTNSST
jgi:hypothetical protein